TPGGLCDWRRGGRSLLPSLLYPADSPAGVARSALLRTDMVLQRSTTSLAAAARHFLRFARTHGGRIFYRKLRRTRFATPSDRGRAILVQEFRPGRPPVHLGSQHSYLFGVPITSRVSLYINLSADGPCFWRASPRRRHSYMDRARL